jgi:transcriptional regulator with XRE-family HTH domain
MLTFPDLLKKIRKEADLTQPEFAKALGVSSALIAMVETGHKDVSKKLIICLAERLHVHPSSITPFLFADQESSGNLSKIEKKFISWGEELQNHLIKDRAKLLRKHAE